MLPLPPSPRERGRVCDPTSQVKGLGTREITHWCEWVAEAHSATAMLGNHPEKEHKGLDSHFGCVAHPSRKRGFRG